MSRRPHRFKSFRTGEFNEDLFNTVESRIDARPAVETPEVDYLTRNSETRSRVMDALQASEGLRGGRLQAPVGPLSAPAGNAPANSAGEGGSSALDWLIAKESSGRTTAKNPTSSAFGLGQLLTANRVAYAKKLGISNPNTTDYNEQLRMMKSYIQDRYGSAEAAQAFHKKKGWY